MPAHRHNACEEGSILRRDVRKLESSDCGPKLAAVDEAGRYGSLDSLPRAGKAVTREQGLHAEEVAVEDRGEDDLVDDDFGGKGEDFGGIVEYGA